MVLSMSVYYSVRGWGGGAHVTITHDALDFTAQEPILFPYTLESRCTGTLLDMFELVHYEAHTVGKRAVGILLKCLLVFT